MGRGDAGNWCLQFMYMVNQMSLDQGWPKVYSQGTLGEEGSPLFLQPHLFPAAERLKAASCLYIQRDLEYSETQKLGQQELKSKDQKPLFVF